MAVESKQEKLSMPQGAPRRICVVTYAVDQDADGNPQVSAELARLFASEADSVTLLWVVGPEVPSVEEVAARRREFEAASVDLRVLDRSDRLLPSLASPESRSAALLHYLEQSRHDLVYVPLEGGLAYFTLLAVETGAFTAPPIIVFACATEEWVHEADKAFIGSTEAIAIAHMERYCAERADRMLCASAALRKWMLAKGWKVRKAAVMPVLPLSPVINGGAARPVLEGEQARELTVFASARFHDGLSLLCDALDLLAPLARADLTVAAFAPFGKIMGEHSGGLLLRRAGNWPFKLKFLPAMGLAEKLDHVARAGALAVIPSLAGSTGNAVAACIATGVPFVATNAGANAEAWHAGSGQPKLVEPDAGRLAKAILAELEKPSRPLPVDRTGDWRQAWLDSRALSPPRAAKRRAAVAPPLVSIVMAHRNRPLYLRQAIAAVEAQTYGRLELVLVDDGSDQQEAIRLLDTLEPSFRERGWRILRRPHRHLGAARNAGLQAARGALILFVDDDNALFPEAVDHFVRAMATSGADICTAFQLIFYEDFVPQDRADGLIQYLPLGGPDALGLIHNVYGDANAMVRRSVFSRIGFFSEQPGYAMHDWEFFARASIAGLKIRPIPRPLYWYRSKPDSMFRTSNWYDNRQPVIDAFGSAPPDVSRQIHQLTVAQNTARSEVESARENLRFIPANRAYLDLCDLDPNSEEALHKLAAIARSRGRGDTAASLPGGNLAGIGQTPWKPDDGWHALGHDALGRARLLTPRASELPLLLVAPGDGGIFLRPHVEGPVAASLDNRFPPFFRKLEAVVEVAHSDAPAIDFCVALARPDQIIDWRHDIGAQTIAFTGWTTVRDKFTLRTLAAMPRVRCKMPLSIVLAVRFTGPPNGFPTNAFFRKLRLSSD